MGRSAPFSTILALSASLLACGDVAPSDTASAIGWTPLVIDSVVRIGGYEARGPSAFGLVRDVEVWGDPLQVAVADWQAQEIRVFDGAGGYARTFGREGEGPGEYKGLTAISAEHPKRLVGWDSDLRRLTVHGDDEDGVIATDFRSFPGRRPQFLGEFNAGSFIFALPVDEGSLRGLSRGEFRDTVPFVRVGPAGTVLEIIALVPAPPRHLFDGGNIWGLEAEVFAPSLLRATVPSGIAIVHGAAPVVEQVFGARRDTLRIPVELAAMTVEAARIERRRRIDAVRSVRVAGVDIAETQREVIASLPAYDTIPAFDALVGGQDGALWLRRYALPPDSLATWLRVREGRPAGSLELPVGEMVVAATGTVVATLSRDDLGALVVRLLWLDR